MTFSQPAFSVSKVVAQGGPQGGVDRTFHTQVTLNGPWAMKLFAMLEPDAFLCLTVLLLCSETAENGGLMVRGGASRVAKEVQWGRPKTSKVLNRLHAAGLIRKEQALKQTPNGPRFVDSVIWITEGDEIRSLFGNPVEPERDSGIEVVDQPGSATGLVNPSAQVGRAVTIPGNGNSSTNIMTMLMNDIHQPDGSDGHATSEAQTYRVLLGWLQQYGFADAESFLVEHPTEVIAAAIAHVQRAPAGSVRNPGGLIRNMVKTGAVPQIVYGIREVPQAPEPTAVSPTPGWHRYEANPDGIGCEVCGMPEGNRRHRGEVKPQSLPESRSNEQAPPATPGLSSLADLVRTSSRAGNLLDAEQPVPAGIPAPTADALNGKVVRLSSQDVAPLREIAQSGGDPMEQLRALLVQRSGNLLADEAG
jgi:hypothetical protein